MPIDFENSESQRRFNFIIESIEEKASLTGLMSFTQDNSDTYPLVKDRGKPTNNCYIPRVREGIVNCVRDELSQVDKGLLIRGLLFHAHNAISAKTNNRAAFILDLIEICEDAGVAQSIATNDQGQVLSRRTTLQEMKSTAVQASLAEAKQQAQGLGAGIDVYKVKRSESMIVPSFFCASGSLFSGSTKLDRLRVLQHGKAGRVSRLYDDKGELVARKVFYHTETGLTEIENVTRAGEATGRERFVNSFVNNNKAHLVMPLASYDLWQQLEDNNPLTLQQALEVANDIKLLHDKSLVHLDIKADNIFIFLGGEGESEHIELADFGTLRSNCEFLGDEPFGSVGHVIPIKMPDGKYATLSRLSLVADSKELMYTYKLCTSDLGDDQGSDTRFSPLNHVKGRFQPKEHDLFAFLVVLCFGLVQGDFTKFKGFLCSTSDYACMKSPMDEIATLRGGQRLSLEKAQHQLGLGFNGKPGDVTFGIDGILTALKSARESVLEASNEQSGNNSPRPF